MHEHEPEDRYSPRADLGLGRVLGMTPIGLTYRRGHDQILLDAEGRLHRAWLDGRSFQRGMSGQLRVVSPNRSVGRQRPRISVLDLAGSTAVLGEILERLALPRGGGDSIPNDLGASLETASRWTLERYAAEQQRFAQVYAPVSILPPDQYRALVLQATLGCAWGRCRFCRLYAAQPYSVRSVDQFRAHVRAALDLHGRAVESRRGVFLGQASALAIPFEHLCGLLDVVREEVGCEPRWPVAAFGDFFNCAPADAELAELRRRGLASVTLGLESGSRKVLERLGKPVVPERAIALALRLRDANISRGITVLVGAGGRARTEEHAQETADVLARMELSSSDRVYLSPLSGPRRPDALADQTAELRAVLKSRGILARLALYDVNRFVY